MCLQRSQCLLIQILQESLLKSKVRITLKSTSQPLTSQTIFAECKRQLVTMMSPRELSNRAAITSTMYLRSQSKNHPLIELLGAELTQQIKLIEMSLAYGTIQIWYLFLSYQRLATTVSIMKCITTVRTLCRLKSLGKCLHLLMATSPISVTRSRRLTTLSLVCKGWCLILSRRLSLASTKLTTRQQESKKSCSNLSQRPQAIA